MAKALIIKYNSILENIPAETIRQEILRQYNAGGIIVLDKSYQCEVVEFDSLEVKDETNII